MTHIETKRSHLCAVGEAALRATLSSVEAELKKYQRESAEENCCSIHPGTILGYHCLACMKEDSARLEAQDRELADLKEQIVKMHGCLSGKLD